MITIALAALTFMVPPKALLQADPVKDGRAYVIQADDLAQVETLCAGMKVHKASRTDILLGCNQEEAPGLFRIVVAKMNDAWPYSAECWVENLSHEVAHVNGGEDATRGHKGWSLYVCSPKR